MALKNFSQGNDVTGGHGGAVRPGEGKSTLTPEELDAEIKKAKAKANTGTGIGFIDEGLDDWDKLQGPGGGNGTYTGASDGVKLANGGVLDSTLSNGTEVGPNAENGGGGSGLQGYGTPGIHYGGDVDGANAWSAIGLGVMNNAQGIQSWTGNESRRNRGPQAIENQQLSDNEAFTRGYDQSGSIQLAREAAMGQAPSEAAYQMQRGLDQSLAAQQSQLGSARGNAGIAMAGANAASNSANLMNQTYNQTGQMRAAEMANARGLYGGLSGQMREQDMNRLQAGNQMGQFNAGLNDQYRLGMAGQANTAAGNVNTAFGNAMHPQDVQVQATTAGHQIGAASHQSLNELEAGITEAEKTRRIEEKNRLLGLAGTVVTAGGGVAGAYLNSQKKPY